jgi:hypothetical protein
MSVQVTWDSGNTYSANPPDNSGYSDNILIPGLTTVDVTVTINATAPTGLDISNDMWLSYYSGGGYHIVSGTIQSVGPVSPGDSLVVQWTSVDASMLPNMEVTVNTGGYTYYLDAGYIYSSTPVVLPIVAPILPTPFVQNQVTPTGTASNPNPYGVDINCLTDLDPFFSLVGGIQCLAQDLYHLITCNTGSLFWAPDLCFNSVGLLGQSTDESELAIIQSNMTNTLLADERVQAATVILQFNYSTSALTSTIQVQPLSGLGVQPFQFVASISQAGNSLLSIAAL